MEKSNSDLIRDYKTGFRVFWDGNMGVGDVFPTTITKEALKLASLAKANGFPGIVFTCVDYEKEALAFTLDLALDSVIESAELPAKKLSDFQPGDKIGFDDFIAEFESACTLETCTENQEPYLEIKYCEKKGRTSKTSQKKYWLQYVGEMPEFHKLASDAPLQPVYEPFHEKRRNFFEHQPSQVQAFKNVMGREKDTVAFASSYSPWHRNVSPTNFFKGKTKIEGNEYELSELLEMDYVTESGKAERKCVSPTDCNPAICLCRRENNLADLYSLVEYLRSGKNITSLVLQVSYAEYIDECLYAINKLKEAGVFVVVFCSKAIAVCSRTLEEKGYLFSDFSNGSTIVADNESRSFSREQENDADALRLMFPVNDDGSLSSVAASLQALRDRKYIFSEKTQHAYMSLNSIFGNALKRTKILSELESSELLDAAKAGIKRLCGDINVKQKEIFELEMASSELAKICSAQCRPQKEAEVYKRMQACAEEGIHLQMIAEDPVGEKEYWDSRLSECAITDLSFEVLTYREFLRQTTPDYPMEVVVTGWFNRDLMDEIVHSGHATKYSLILYKSQRCNLEVSWYTNAVNAQKKVDGECAKRTCETYKKLGLEKSMPRIKQAADFEEKKRTVADEKRIDDSPISLVREMKLALAKRQIGASEQDTIQAKPVFFDEGRVIFLAVGDSMGAGSRLPIVMMIDGAYKVVRKRAFAIEPGDLYLHVVDNDDLASLSAKENLGFEYDRQLETARSWRAGIDHLLSSGSSVVSIVNRIVAAGCKKNDATIRNWIVQDKTIAPQDIEDIRAILKATGCKYDEEIVLKIYYAACGIRGSHIQAGREISNDSIQAFEEDAAEMELGDVLKGFTVRHPGHKDMMLLHVDFVDETVQVGYSQANRLFSL